MTLEEENLQLKAKIHDFEYALARLVKTINTITKKDVCCPDPNYSLRRYSKDGMAASVKCYNCGKEIEVE